jgi:hypothetical protein
MSRAVLPDEPLNRLSMTVLMTPDMSNFSGNVHGGLLLKLLDQVGLHLPQPLRPRLRCDAVGGPGHLP